MRTRSLLVVLILVSVVLTTAHAQAQSDRTCPPTASGFAAFPINDPGWTLGDPVPARSDEPLWDLTVAGFAEASLTLQESAEVFGLATVDELYALILAGWLLRVDKNDDLVVCVQAFPDASQIPPYFFNFIDNNARLPS